MHVTTFIEITIAGRCTHRDRNGEKGGREMDEKRCKEADRERKRYAHRHTKVRPGALHTLWHTFQRRADDIGIPYGLAFVEHGSNEAKILLAQSVVFKRGKEQ